MRFSESRSALFLAEIGQGRIRRTEVRPSCKRHLLYRRQRSVFLKRSISKPISEESRSVALLPMLPLLSAAI